MSAPEVGDRVRVIAGQWEGWEGSVLDVLDGGHLWVALTKPGSVVRPYVRPLTVGEVEKVPTTPVDAPRSHETGADVETDAGTVRGAQRGGKR